MKLEIKTRCLLKIHNDTLFELIILHMSMADMEKDVMSQGSNCGFQKFPYYFVVRFTNE